MKTYTRILLAIVFSAIYHSFHYYTSIWVYLIGIMFTTLFAYIGLYFGELGFNKMFRNGKNSIETPTFKRKNGTSMHYNKKEG